MRQRPAHACLRLATSMPCAPVALPEVRTGASARPATRATGPSANVVLAGRTRQRLATTSASAVPQTRRLAERVQRLLTSARAFRDTNARADQMPHAFLSGARHCLTLPAEALFRIHAETPLAARATSSARRATARSVATGPNWPPETFPGTAYQINHAAARTTRHGPDWSSSARRFTARRFSLRATAHSSVRAAPSSSTQPVEPHAERATTCTVSRT